MTVLHAGVTDKKEAFKLALNRYKHLDSIQPSKRKDTNMYTFWPSTPGISFPAELLKMRVFYRPDTETYDVCLV